MNMHTFIHGRDCKAKTYPTICSRCDAKVFFFQCQCGSKVFFDELGSPWPLHNCDDSWAKNLRRTQDASGAITVQISSGVTLTRPPEGSISPEVAAESTRRAQKPDPIEAIKPSEDDEVEVTGILREMDQNTDIVKALKLSPTSMTVAALNELAIGDWGQVTIHQQMDGTLHSYTAFVPVDALRQAGNKIGAIIETTLDARRILPASRQDYVWICREYLVIS